MPRNSSELLFPYLQAIILQGKKWNLLEDIAKLLLLHPTHITTVLGGLYGRLHQRAQEERKLLGDRGGNVTASGLGSRSSRLRRNILYP